MKKIGGSLTKKKSFSDRKLLMSVGNYLVKYNQVLGKGQFSEVYLASKDSSIEGEPCACKIINKKQLQKLQMYDHQKCLQMKKRFENEIAFHLSIQNERNIVKLYDTFQDEKAYYLFLQLCETDLGRILKQKKRLCQKTALEYFKQILIGYQNIRNKNAFHRDLKPQNILVSKGQLKIADFGSIKLNPDSPSIKKQNELFRPVAATFAGSIRYMSPQVLKVNHQSDSYDLEKSDIWSLGVILYRMLYESQPFTGKTEIEIMQQIKQKQVIFDNDTPITSGTINLLKKMINKSETERITFNQLKQEFNKVYKNFEKILKIKLLKFYSKIIDELYKDTTSNASLRQIGFETDYFKIGYQIISLLHEKRIKIISQQKLQLSLVKDILAYHETFHSAIKSRSFFQKNTDVKQILEKVIRKLEEYKHHQPYQYLADSSIKLFQHLTQLLKMLKQKNSNYIYLLRQEKKGF